MNHFRKLERMYAHAPCNGHFSPLLVVSEGRAEVRLQVRSEFHHSAGAMHGMVYFKALDDAVFTEIHQALLENEVLFFPGSQLDDDAQMALAHRFGQPSVFPLLKLMGETGPTFQVIEDGPDSPNEADYWHTDVTCDVIPPLGSMLYMKETPASGGGDTLYADMYLAYELLSDTMKEILSDLVAVHDGELPYLRNYKVAAPDGQEYPKNEHPMITTHPETGKKVLYVNSGFTSRIKGLATWESDAILNSLKQFIASTPRLTCRVSWKPNTLTFWDNRCTQHHAVWDYWPDTRSGERVSILGSKRPAA